MQDISVSPVLRNWSLQARCSGSFKEQYKKQQKKFRSREGDIWCAGLLDRFVLIAPAFVFYIIVNLMCFGFGLLIKQNQWLVAIFQGVWWTKLFIKMHTHKYTHTHTPPIEKTANGVCASDIIICLRNMWYVFLLSVFQWCKKRNRLKWVDNENVNLQQYVIIFYSWSHLYFCHS